MTPFAAFIFSPVIGYAGDKVILQDLTSPRPQLGYKPVLVFSVVAALVSGGALSLLPHYTRHLPKVHPTLPPGPPGRCGGVRLQHLPALGVGGLGPPLRCLHLPTSAGGGGVWRGAVEGGGAPGEQLLRGGGGEVRRGEHLLLPMSSNCLQCFNPVLQVI